MGCRLLLGPVADYEESKPVCDSRKNRQQIRQRDNLCAYLVSAKSPMLILHMILKRLHDIPLLKIILPPFFANI